MKWFVAYDGDGEGDIVVKEFDSREAMLLKVEHYHKMGIRILCVWSEAR